MKTAIVALTLGLLACGDPAEFRPAKGAHDMPSVATAYRIQDASEGCPDIGGIVDARSVDDVAATAARHGGTHYRILNDFADSSVETNTTAAKNFGIVHAHSTSREVTRHAYSARVYRCE